MSAHLSTKEGNLIMSSKFWRLNNQKITSMYKEGKLDHLPSASIVQMYTKKSQRHMQSSEEKNPSKLILALIDRAIYTMMLEPQIDKHKAV